MKFSWKSYYEPTPTNFRKWGDIWATFWLSLTGVAIIGSHQYISLSCLILGYLGKAFSNFFTNNNKQESGGD
jgi:hypothetical protein